MYRGLIAAAGLTPRLHSLRDKGNIVFGSASVPFTIATSSWQPGGPESAFLVGAGAVSRARAGRACSVMNPFYQQPSPCDLTKPLQLSTEHHRASVRTA
jgi:hypothetical protein